MGVTDMRWLAPRTKMPFLSAQAQAWCYLTLICAGRTS
jgi:hypothetical protein